MTLNALTFVHVYNRRLKSMQTQATSDQLTRQASIPKDQVPTLEDFMNLITDESKSVTSTPSGYNVYNKYHKSS